MAGLIPSEDAEQVRFVHWLDDSGYKYTSIPNSTFTKSWNQKRRNHMLGLRAGFPDLVVIAEGHFICVEMKRVKDSYPTQNQKDWIEALTEAGVSAKVCKGATEAIAFVQSVTGSRGGGESKSGSNLF